MVVLRLRPADAGRGSPSERAAMEFVCRLGTPDGRVVEEVHRAPRRVGAARRARAPRPPPLRDRAARGLPLRSRLAVGPAPAGASPPRTFLVFNQELAALLKAGLPLLQALDLMLERHAATRASARVLTDIRDRVKSGEDLSDAFAAYGELFPPLYAVDASRPASAPASSSR